MSDWNDEAKRLIRSGVVDPGRIAGRVMRKIKPAEMKALVQELLRDRIRIMIHQVRGTVSMNGTVGLARHTRIDPNKMQPRLGLFYFYVGKKEFDNAKTEIEKLVEKNPENANLTILLGNFYFMLKENDRALESYSKAVELDPENIKFHMVLAGFYGATGGKDKALNTYYKALKLQPENINVKFAIARFYFRNEFVS